MSAHVGLSLMLADDFRRATTPLFEAGVVDVLEWSFDTGWDVDVRAPWAAGLLDHFAAAGRLLGHGVTFSPLSASWQPRQTEWLARLERECGRRQYEHVSEHFGFVTVDGTTDGAPLPMPFSDAAVAVGHDRLQRLAAAARRPIGLENLAFAFSAEDVAAQGAFLEALLAPIDGFVVLDLHNLHCQAHNFDIDPGELLESYPLNRVRELHVSGGSWSAAADGSRVRRDTHDDAVPDEVLALVARALQRCPHVECVILERLGGTLAQPAAAQRLRDDYARLRTLVTEISDGRS